MIARKILTFRKLGSSASISFLSSFLVKAFPCLPSWAYLLNTVIMESMDFSKSVMVAEMSAERTKGRNGHKYNRFFFFTFTVGLLHSHWRKMSEKCSQALGYSTLFEEDVGVGFYWHSKQILLAQITFWPQTQNPYMGSTSPLFINFNT